MRRLVLTLLACLFVAPGAAAAAMRGPGDGTLVVKNANATKIVVEGRGAIFGHFETGTLTVVDYNPFDTKDPQMNGCVRTQQKSDTTTVCKGGDVRFYFSGGKYKLILSGFDISLSAVGKGTVSLAGQGTTDDGTFAVNGGKPQALPPYLPTVATFGNNP
jgi:hypothetical protein